MAPSRRSNGVLTGSASEFPAGLRDPNAALSCEVARSVHRHVARLACETGREKIEAGESDAKLAPGPHLAAMPPAADELDNRCRGVDLPSPEKEAPGLVLLVGHYSVCDAPPKLHRHAGSRDRAGVRDRASAGPWPGTVKRRTPDLLAGQPLQSDADRLPPILEAPRVACHARKRPVTRG